MDAIKTSARLAYIELDWAACDRDDHYLTTNHVHCQEQVHADTYRITPHEPGPRKRDPSKLALNYKIVILPPSGTMSDVNLGRDPGIGFALARYDLQGTIQTRSLDLAFSIYPPWQGKGYGPEAIEFFLHEIFTNDLAWRGTDKLEPCHNVHLSANSKNARAMAVYEKLGFQPAVRLRDVILLEGKPYDKCFMDMTRAEYFARYGPDSAVDEEASKQARMKAERTA